MNAYLTLGIAALLPSFATVLVILTEKNTSFSKLSKLVKQIICGVIFGALAVIGTEWGIPVNGAQINCRDASVVVAGLLFGPVSGVIAGTIGAVERWVAVAWGVGSFTRLACTVSTFIAGLYSAALRKILFKDKRPSWVIAFTAGIVIEVFHLTMVFVTNMSTPEEAMAVVKACTIPMVTANGVSVLLSSVIATVISNEKDNSAGKKTTLSKKIQGWLLIVVVFAFVATTFFLARLQISIASNQTDKLLSTAIKDTSNEIIDVIDLNPSKELQAVQIIARNRHVGQKGMVVILDSENQFASLPDLYRHGLSIDLNSLRFDKSTFSTTVGSTQYYAKCEKTKGYTIISLLPKSEALSMQETALYVNTFLEILVLALVFGMIYGLINKTVVSQIEKVNGSLSKIITGNLDEIVNVRSTEEFVSLSDDINSTVSTLRKYISEAEARIDRELEFAKEIQASALPTVFNKNEKYDIFALMNPAKEVGGDFYDFYQTGTDNLNFLVADVSGKGIPAAMFMMRAKTELRSLTESGEPVNMVFTKGNNALCEGNNAGMFVTAWQGCLNLNTGHLQYANAGHNPPLVMHNGKFEFIKSKPGFVLAGMEGIPYKTQELNLETGDILFLYTDGVTEASNCDNELYGEERLLKLLNSRTYSSMEEMCGFVKASIDEFTGTADQFDDITMVALRYGNTVFEKTMHIDEAVVDDINKVTTFIDEQLHTISCPEKQVRQINIAVDEIFSNIVLHGYYGKKGPVSVSVIPQENTVTIRFLDSGVPYNPLETKEPDITLSADERAIGGLGIFISKKIMTDIYYEYKNGQNMLTIVKDFSN